MPIVSFLLSTTLVLASAAQAQPHSIKGSDTLAGVLTEAIAAADMTSRITYDGGGSTRGEEAFVVGEQGVVPMSRPLQPSALAAALARGITPVAHVIGLDGIGIFVHGSNATPQLTLGQLRAIFTCETTQWRDVPGSGRSGTIRVLRRDDRSGTTDTFKHLVGISQFGPCASPLSETSDVAQATTTDANAIAYAGLAARREGNRAVAIAANDTLDAVVPSLSSIRAKTYPLSRQLLVYEATKSRTPNEVEAELLEYLLDRSYMDPIIQDHGFHTVD
jgi:phosphate transport system substrate-binding protein